MRKLLLALAVFVVALLLLNFVISPNLLSWLFTRAPKPTQTQQQPSQTGQKLIEEPPAISPPTAFPIALGHPSIDAASLFYRFSGKIRNVSTNKEGETLLTLESKNGTPLAELFTISKQTGIRYKNSQQSLTASDLKVGAALELIYMVDLKTSQTLVTQVVVER